MLNTILSLIIILSFLGILVILFRKIPHIANLSEGELAALSQKRGLIANAIHVFKRHKSPHTEIQTSSLKSKRPVKYLQFLNKILGQSKVFLKHTGIKIWMFLNKLFKKILIMNKILDFLLHKINKLTSLFKKTNRIESTEKVKEKNNYQIKEKIDNKTTEKQLIDDFLKEKIENQNFETEVFTTVESKPIINRISIADLEKPMQEEQELIDLIVKNPKNIIAYKALGLYYWKHKNHGDAKASLETAVKLGSKDKQVLKILEEIKNFENHQS